MTVTLSPATLADARQIVTWPTDPEEWFEWAAHDLTYHADPLALLALCHRDHHGLAAHHGTDLVAFATLTIDPRNRAARINHLITHPDRRGQGLGAATVRALTTEAATHRAHRVDMWVPATNSAATGAATAAGLTYEGTAVDAQLFRGRFRSLFLMATITADILTPDAAAPHPDGTLTAA